MAEVAPVTTVLVLNAGSSSLKYSLVDVGPQESVAAGLVERIGEPTATLTHHARGGTFRATVQGSTSRGSPDRCVASHEDALHSVIEAFAVHGPSLEEAGLVAVGHRVVHGGPRFSAPALVDDDLVAAVHALVPLAPLHNPANLAGIETARGLFPDLPQVAVFDTAFHRSMPEHASTYAVPLALRDEHALRRYGFHGTSYSMVSRAAAALLGHDVSEVNLVVLHLGNGASAAAVRGGRSVDTSMGLTPLPGLVMGTRSGDVDPSVHAYLHAQLGWSTEEVDRVLNRESGLKGLAGVSDFRSLTELRDSGDPAATLAFDVYCHRIKSYVGAYFAVLGTVDAIVLTAGVGENVPAVRAASLAGLERLGIAVDPVRNEQPGSGPRVVSPDGSEVAVLVVPTNEEGEIARQTMSVVRS